MTATVLGMMVMAFSAVGCAASAPEGEELASSESAIGDQLDNVAVFRELVRPTENFGFLNAPVTKPFNDARIEEDCGGSYTVHAAIDIGRIDHDSIEVRSVIYYYVGNRYALVPLHRMTIGSNGTPGDDAYSGWVQLDDNGTWYQKFEINKTFHGVRADAEGLNLSHRVHPDAPYWGPADGRALCGMNVKTLIQVVD